MADLHSEQPVPENAEVLYIMPDELDRMIDQGTWPKPHESGGQCMLDLSTTGLAYITPGHPDYWRMVDTFTTPEAKKRWQKWKMETEARAAQQRQRDENSWVIETRSEDFGFGVGAKEQISKPVRQQAKAKRRQMRCMQVRPDPELWSRVVQTHREDGRTIREIYTTAITNLVVLKYRRHKYINNKYSSNTIKYKNIYLPHCLASDLIEYALKDGGRNNAINTAILNYCL